MSAAGVADLPDPMAAASAAELAEALRRLRLWAGQPSLRRLRQLGGTVVDRAGREIDALPEATTSHVLRGHRPPRAELLRALVTACLRARRRGPEEIAIQVERWHAAWLSVNGQPPRADPATGSVPGSAPVPRQLPPGVATFTGRGHQLAALNAWFAGADGGTPAPVRIRTVDGIAGVGKTALVVAWAHRVRHQFPDGQLHADLRGFAAGQPVTPVEALSRFLHALGVPPERTPTDVDEAAAMYRSLLADRRMLVVLDNAADAEQVRPLLPSGPGSLVLVTSRGQLAGLVARDGAYRLALDVLTPDESVTLLTELLGADRAAAEPDAVAELAARCHHLPLALRIAAADAAADPPRRVADYVAQFRERDPLRVLTVSGDEQVAVAAAFDLSYERLPGPVQRMFRLLGLVPGPDFTPAGAARLAGTSIEEAEPALRELAGVHLLERRAVGRFGFHDLLRCYAADLAHRAETSADRHAALTRLYDYYVRTSDAATSLLHPSVVRLPRAVDRAPATAADRFTGHAAALAWLDSERANLVACGVRAAAHGPYPVAWQLADSLRSYLWGSYLVDASRLAHAALTAAEAAGDRPGQAASLIGLTLVSDRESRYSELIQRATRALALAGRAGWVGGQGTAHRALGRACWQLGRLAEALHHQEQALACFQQCGWQPGQAAAKNSLGVVHLHLGDLARAAQLTGRALALNRAVGSSYGEAASLATLGDVHRYLGNFDRARSLFTSARSRFEVVGGRDGVGDSLRGLAAVHRDAGRPAQAFALAREAADIHRETGHRRLEVDVLLTIAGIELLTGAPEAVASYRRGRELARDGGNRYLETAALLGLASAYLQRGAAGPARDHATQALTLAEAAGYRLLEGRARTVLARVHLGLHDPARARTEAEHAVAVQRETGHRPGEAHALLALGHAARSAGDTDHAYACWRAAHVLLTRIGAPEAHEAGTLLVS